MTRMGQRPWLILKRKYPVEVSKVKKIEEEEPDEVVMDSYAQDGANENVRQILTLFLFEI
jgi:hypothetical protein